jgi:hypothetical protein
MTGYFDFVVWRMPSVEPIQPLLEGITARHDIPLDADQLQCVEEVSAECEDAKNSGQLCVCVNKGVRKQKLRPACLSYLYQ